MTVKEEKINILTLATALRRGLQYSLVGYFRRAEQSRALSIKVPGKN